MSEPSGKMNMNTATHKNRLGSRTRENLMRIQSEEMLRGLLLAMLCLPSTLCFPKPRPRSITGLVEQAYCLIQYVWQTNLLIHLNGASRSTFLNILGRFARL